jgi:2',3'-cyclic-nucleotide 2'-phosphodiesterase (5'-nucleotidase family)
VDVPLVHVKRDHDRQEMKKLFERALREETGADLAHINSGAVRENFSEGELLVRGVWNAMPFDDRVVTVTARGSQLPASIRQEHGLADDSTYKVATIDFVVGQWKLRGSADLVVEEGEVLRDLLLRWIAAQGRL